MNWLQRVAASYLGKQFGIGGGSVVSMISGSSLGSGRRKFDARSVLQAYDTSPWFRAVVERVSFAAAVVPWQLFAVKPARGSRDWQAGRSYVKHTTLQTAGSIETRERAMKQLASNDQLEEIPDHPMLDLLSSPNPVLTGIDMRLITFASLIVVGEIGWAITRGKFKGKPTVEEIWPIPSHWIVRRPGERGSDSFVVHVGGNQFRFSTDEFVLFRNPTLTNPYGRGAGTGSTLADELSTDEYIAKFQSRWFLNSGKPDLIFTAKPSKAGKSVNDDDLIASKERFENGYRGIDRGGQSFWVNGDIKVTELKSKLIDLDLTEQRTWIKDLVHQVIGAPPEIMGVLTSSNRATIDQALAILAIVTTVPQLERVRAQLQMQLVPAFDERLALGFVSPIPEDREFRLKAMLARPSAATTREWRKIQGLEDRGEADEVHQVPINLIEVPAPKKQVRSMRSPKILTADETKALSAVTNTKATAADVEVWLNALQPQTLTVEVAPLWSDEFKKWGEDTTATLGIDPSAFSMVNPFVEQHLLDFATNRIVDINNTTLRQLRKTLLEGVNAGEGIPELAKRVESVFVIGDRSRSVVIARTEVLRSSNAATFEAYKQSGIVEEIQWITSFVNSRETHKLLHGTVVGLGEDFVSSSGATAPRPGEFGVAAEDIQCACAIVAVIGEPKALDVLEVLLRVFEAEKQPWEVQARQAFRRGFAQQEQDVLEAMAS